MSSQGLLEDGVSYVHNDPGPYQLCTLEMFQECILGSASMALGISYVLRAAVCQKTELNLLSMCVFYKASQAFSLAHRSSRLSLSLPTKDRTVSPASADLWIELLSRPAYSLAVPLPLATGSPDPLTPMPRTTLNDNLTFIQ